MKTTKTTSATQGQSASELISKRIAELGDWRGKTLARMRKLITSAPPGPARSHTSTGRAMRDVITGESELRGVRRMQAGNHHVRGRTIDPRTGKMREVNRALPDVSKARDAFAWLQAELEEIRSGVVAEQPSLATQFHAYAADVFKWKPDLRHAGRVRRTAGPRARCRAPGPAAAGAELHFIVVAPGVAPGVAGRWRIAIAADVAAPERSTTTWPPSP